MAKGRPRNTEDKKYDERVLHIRRVSKKTTGGNYVSFSALVAVGDGKGSVGIGIGRGLEVPPAIQKGMTQAKKRMVKLPIFNDSLPHEIKLKYKSARILLKPAPPGTGLKVGGVVRAVLDIAGVNNASGKIMGTRNQITNAYAVMEAIKRLKPRITAETKKEKPVEETATQEIEEKPEVKVVEEKAVKEKKETTSVKKIAKKPAATKKVPAEKKTTEKPAKKPAKKIKKESK